jgi:hypothetical protein
MKLKFSTPQVTGGAAVLALGLLMATGASAATISAKPWVYDPGNSGTAVATWTTVGTTTTPISKDDCKNGGWKTVGTYRNQGDCVSDAARHRVFSTTFDQVLTLQKNASTTFNSAAGASIEGLATSTLTELGFDYKTGTYCGAGAPRFNVYTTAGTYYFFGCTYGTHTDLGNGWTRVRFANADAQPADGVTAFPGFGSTTVTGIEIVQDEEGQALLDNIDINGTLIDSQ